jgi:hypothetical protein
MFWQKGIWLMLYHYYLKREQEKKKRAKEDTTWEVTQLDATCQYVKKA